jgi:hypothetical protein
MNCPFTHTGCDNECWSYCGGICLFDILLREARNAFNEKGEKDKKGDGKAVRKRKGKEGVLREPKQDKGNS